MVNLKRRNFNKYKECFTLSETLITLSVLGIISAIVIPSMVRNHTENTNRVKLKKTVAVYEAAINKMAIEHGLRDNNSLDEFGSDNCKKTIEYFKIAEKTGNCTFKSSDGVFWDISNIRKAVVSFSEQTLNTETADSDANRAFYLISSFDTHNGALRINDLASESEEDKIATERLYDYISGKTKSSYIAAVNTCDSICKLKKGSYNQICENGVTRACSTKDGASLLANAGEKLDAFISNLKVYDEDGNLILVTSSNGRTVTENHYDESGTLTDYIKSQFNSDGNITKRQEFEPLYASNGTLIKDQELKNKEWRNYDSDGKPTEIFESENTFDEQGNRSTTHKTTNYQSDSKGDIVLINTYSREVSPKDSNKTYEVYMSQERKNYQGDIENGTYRKSYGENYERVKTTESGNVVYYETTTNGTGSDKDESLNNFVHGYNKLVQKTTDNGDIYYEYYKSCDSSFANCNSTATECRQQNLQSKTPCP